MVSFREACNQILHNISSTELLKRRIIMSVFGVLICGISVGMFKTAALGVDPFQSLMSGLDSVIPIHFGTLYVLVNMLLLMFSLIFDRHKIGLATIINLFLLGYVAEYSQNIFMGFLPDLSLVWRFVLLILAVVIMCVSSSLYFTADLGVSTYDSLSLIISEKQARVSFKYCRIISDFLCVILGTALCLLSGYTLSEIGAVVGIGTIITAFFMGPLIDYFNVHLSQRFLK